VTTTTFGYDALQDRIWMRSHDLDQTVWLTRRMVSSMLGPLLKAFETATPGQQGGAPAAQRVAIEHRLALHEVAPGQPPARLTASRVTPGANADPQLRLCQRIVTRSGSQSVLLRFETGAEPLELKLGRRGMHLWLRGLAMVLRQTQWGLPPLPDWLHEGVMPPVLQGLVDRAGQSAPPPPESAPPASPASPGDN